MSITVGICIERRSDQKSISNSAYASWKNWDVNTWISDWFSLHKTQGRPEYFEAGEDGFRCSILKDDLLRMADDLINRRFDVCPDAYEDFEGEDEIEEMLERYGYALRNLAENLQDDQMLVYYNYIS